MRDDIPKGKLPLSSFIYICRKKLFAMTITKKNQVELVKMKFVNHQKNLSTVWDERITKNSSECDSVCGTRKERWVFGQVEYTVVARLEPPTVII
jgi:hypothetical protein